MIDFSLSMSVDHVAVAPPPSWGGAATTWVLTWQITTSLVAVAAAYVIAVSVVNRRHPRNRWPVVRLASFLLGLCVVAFATQGEVAAYDDVLFSMHMAQHLLLIMVAPALLVYGRPMTLALHSARNPWHSRIKRLVRSRVVTLATSPMVATPLYVGVVVGTHLTWFMDLVLAHPVAHDTEHLLYLLVGYVFFLPIVGSEPLRNRPSLGMRYALLILTMPVDTLVGVVLMMATHELFRGYADPGRRWVPTPLTDLHTGGAVMWIGGDAVMAALVLVLTCGLVAGRGARPILGARIERARVRTLHDSLIGTGLSALPPRPRTIDDDAHLSAYNDYLASLANDGRH